jgi:hypothetical protein
MNARFLPAAWLVMPALFLVPTAMVHAADCLSNAGGNWSAAGTWTACGGGTPGAGDTATIRNAHAVTLNVAATVSALSIQPTATGTGNSTLSVGGQSLTVTGHLTINGGNNANRLSVLSIGTGSVTVGGNLVISGTTANSRVTFTGSGALNLAGAFDATTVFTASTGTVNYNGSGAQIIPAYAYNNLHVNKTAGTATLSGDTAVGGNLSIGTAGGTLDLSTFTANRTATGGTLTVVNGATLRIGGTNTFPANYTTNTLQAASTVEYYGGDQNVHNLTYGHLILSGGSTKTPLPGTTTIAGNFTLGTGTTYAGTTNNPTVSLAGNFSNSGTFNSGTGTFTFNGTAVQNLSGATTFTNATLSNSAGLNLSGNMSVTGTLTLISGKITTGASRVIIGASGSISGATDAGAGRYVVGTVEKNFTATGTFDFPIGDPSNYTPVNLSVTTLGAAGGIAASQTVGDHPNIGTSGLNPDLSVNRYWTLASTGFAGTFDATFNYVTGDKDLAANPPDFEVERFSSGTWTRKTVSNRVGNSISITGVTGFGDFAIAEAGGNANHFYISHDGTGVNCEPELVTVSAHRSNHNIVSFTGAATLESYVDGTGTRRGDWTSHPGNSGTLTPGAPDSGIATYNFVTADAGIASFYLRYTYPDVVDINVTSGTLGENTGTANNGSEPPPGTDPKLTFYNSGFRITDGAGGPAAIGPQIAGKPSNVNPGMQTLAIQAIRTDTETFACVGVFASDAELDIGMASECIDPTSCAGRNVHITTPATVNNSVDIANHDLGAVPALPSVLTPVTFRFSGATSEAPFTLRYPDAGRIMLHIRRDIPLESGDGSGNFMVGSGGPFLVRPFALHLDIPGNPAAADASGGAFQRAGVDFTVNVSAVAWESVDDGNNDGSADDGADLSDNATTPNFGNEVTPETVTITHTLLAPAGQAPGDLTGGGSISVAGGGPAAADLSWDEVGIIRLNAALSSGSYLGSGLGVTGSSRAPGNSDGNVGRFYPARLHVTANVPLFADACTAGDNPFTYQDQPFPFATAPILTVTARNAAGGTTLNYGGGTSGPAGFWKLDSDLERSYTDQAGMSADFAAVQDDTVTLDGHLDFDGTGTLALDSGSDGDAFLYARQDPEAEFEANVDVTFTIAALTDSDGACYDPDENATCDPYTIPGIADAHLRYGRMIIGNATGSELLPLKVPMRTEYFDGSAFVVNRDDLCTALQPTDLVLSSDVETDETDGDIDVSAEADCADGTSTAAIDNSPFAEGDAGLSFSAPGRNCTGYVDITTDLGIGGLDMEWLRFDWDGDGDLDDDPRGRATFGIYPGRNSLIYQREPWP